MKMTDYACKQGCHVGSNRKTWAVHASVSFVSRSQCADAGAGVGVAAQDEVFLNGTIVLPHKELKETVLDQGTIIM